MFSLFKNKKTLSHEKSQTRRQKDYTDPQPIADYFINKTGVSFEKQMSILKSKLTSFCTLREIDGFSECLSQVKTDPQLEQELIDYLTTNETYFYREFAQIENLVQQILANTAKVDILCAPCSTGEEPYSIAIALLEAGVPAGQFSIQGIDINFSALKSATNAVYRERNISKMPKHLVTKYFELEQKKYRLKPVIKNLVQVKQFNLFDSGIHQIGKFDYILSRNLLIYFDQPTKQKASKILQNMLKDPQQKVLYGHADLY
ncbi:MAG: protein-glutamate O-methyltransferase CheR [Gammaproteobacteria bacterium]|nr:protein-glutamate O-methyltransferase CheR [Gammaproteobacteria bacterium]